MRYYVIKDESGCMLEFDSNPYGDGACLVNNIPTSFTVFGTKKDANKALRLSKKYAKKDKIDDLYSLWHMDEWEVCLLEIDQ